MNWRTIYSQKSLLEKTALTPFQNFDNAGWSARGIRRFRGRMLYLTDITQCAYGIRTQVSVPNYFRGS